MAVYVRIAIRLGDLAEVQSLSLNDAAALRAEDAYQSYSGCAECGYPMQGKQLDPSWGMGPVADWAEIERPKGGKGCPGCEAGRKDGPNVYLIPLAQHNPRVDIADDGSLTVSQGEQRLGYYPAGAWLSYRSDAPDLTPPGPRDAKHHAEEELSSSCSRTEFPVNAMRGDNPSGHVRHAGLAELVDLEAPDQRAVCAACPVIEKCAAWAGWFRWTETTVAGRSYDSAPLRERRRTPAT